MKNNIWNKKFPSLAGIGLLILVTFITAALIPHSQNNTSTKASFSPIPQNVQVSNNSDKSVTITYTTQGPTTGTILYGQTTQNQSNEKTDDFASLNNGELTVHIFTLTNLIPNTKYYFSIVSDSKTYTDNGIPYSAQTGVTLSGTSSQGTMSGKIIGTDGKPLPHILVTAFIPQAEVLSSVTDTSGNYVIPLGAFRNADLTNYISVTSDAHIIITATDGESEASATLLGANSHTIPVITLSQNYDFSQTQANPTPNSPGALLPLSDTNGGNTGIITLADNSKLTDPQPTFKGTVNPNTSVTITISPGDISGQVDADENGYWQYQPTSPLQVGDYTISVTAQDPNGGADTTVSRSFTILPSGSQVSGSATPSATPTVEITITATPSPTPATTGAESPTPSPTESSEITATPTIPPTSQPTKQPLPPTGSNIALPLGIVGSVITTLGILLFVL